MLPQKLPSIYPVAILGESIVAGWLLSEYQASIWAWIGTCAVISHIARVGFDAVATGIVWIVFLVWRGAFAGSWFRSWRWSGIAAWAGALAGIWIFGLILLLTLAQARKALLSTRWRKDRIFWVLAIASWLGLSIGWLLGQYFNLKNGSYHTPFS